MPLPAKMDVDDAASSREMLHLSSREVPPGGMSFKILALSETSPRDAWVGPFNSIYDLANEVHKRERANGLELTPDSEIEDQVCQRCPPGYCRDAHNLPTRHPGGLNMGLSEVIAGTRALMNWFKHGSVAVEEIARRTSICNTCPENRPISGCQGCAANALHAVMNAIVVRPLASDAVLGACAICQCSLKAKVRMRLDDLPPLSPSQRERLPEKCWIIAPASARDGDPRT